MPETIEGRTAAYAERDLSPAEGRVSKNASVSRARSNGRSTGRPRATVSSSPTATPCPRPKAAPTRRASGPPSSRACAPMASSRASRKAANITRDDLTSGGCALVSCFIREPEFVGQTKDRLATTEAAKLVEAAVRDRFDTWLGNDTKSAGAILDFLILRAEERLRRRAEKETARKSATKKLRLPGKLVDCSTATGARRHRIIHRRGRQRGRLGQNGPRPQDASAPAAARQDPERAGRGKLKARARTPRSPISVKRLACRWAPSSTSRTCATTRSSS